MDTLEKNKQSNPANSIKLAPPRRQINLPNKDIFRAYDIRGQIGREWCIDNDYHIAFLIGQAIATQLQQKQGVYSRQIIVGRDGRLSSPVIAEQLIKGLRSAGCAVVDLGLTATPVVYFALQHLHIPNSVMVTGSHNPPDHNGIKIVYGLKPLAESEIKAIFHIIQKQDFVTHTKYASYQQYTRIIQAYQKALVNNIRLKRRLKIGIDAGNGATSIFSESLFTQLGCQVSAIFCEVDGNFPNHSPDPTSPQNLQALMKLVKQQQLDIGIAFDGDGDRIIAIDNKGNILWPDRIMMLLAQDVLKNNPGATIVYDVKCSYLLPKVIKQAGGKPSMCISGHSILKREMLRQNAIMGGEFSGHIVMPDRWSEFDDGPYIAARLLEILASTDVPCNEVFAQFPQTFSTPEEKISFDNPRQARQALKEFIQYADFAAGRISLIDGFRIDYEDGWGLVRSSNTSSSLTLRFEANSKKRLQEIQDQFRNIFKKSKLSQKLPF